VTSDHFFLLLNVRKILPLKSLIEDQSNRSHSPR